MLISSAIMQGQDYCSAMPPGPEQTRAILSTIAVLNEDGDQGLGRAFIVERPNSQERLVITAAHCLPFLPFQPFVDRVISRTERTYKSLIGPLGKQAEVSAECLFVDPVADIAVLGCPDERELSSEAAEYEQLVSSSNCLAIADVQDQAAAWIMLLDGHWSRCKVQYGVGEELWLVNADINRGMSGSPILDLDGRATGVLRSGCLGARFGGPHARLASHLPGWMLADLFRDHASARLL